MSKLHSFFIIASLLLTACSGGQKKPDIEELAEMDSIDSANDTLHLVEDIVEPPKAVDELFDDFFFTFVSDARFQNQRVNFPLKCYDDDLQIDIDKDDWHQLNYFSSQEFFAVIYENEAEMELQKDTSVSRVNVECIYLDDDYAETFHFRRINSKWRLTDMAKSGVENLPNGDFLQFYSRFLADSTYQAENIVLPLRFTYTEDGGDESEPDADMSLNEWYEIKQELPIPHGVLLNINYGQKSHSHSDKVLLMESASSGLYMKFKFRSTNGEWKLYEIEN